MPSEEARRYFEETLSQGPRSDQIASDIHKSQSMFQRSVTKAPRQLDGLVDSSDAQPEVQ